MNKQKQWAGMKRRIKSIGIMISVFLMLFSGMTMLPERFGGPAVVQAATPTIITTAAQLNGVRNNLSGSYKLGANIDLSGYSSWVPIGDNSNQFTGTFDGGGYAISHVTINGSATHVGLFGFIGSAGTIKNVGLTSVNITGSGFVGGVAGKNFGTITNAYVSGSVKSTGSNYPVGGVASYNYGTITNAYVSGSVFGGSSATAGGVVGDNENSISNVYFTGSVSVSSGSAGGILGNNHGSVSDSYTNFSPLSAYNVAGYSSVTSSSVKSLSDMELQSTYSGWDFTTMWGISAGQTTPYLRSFSYSSPTVSFGTNGSGTSYAQSVSSTVTVNDAGSGVNAGSLEYVWTQSTSTPGSTAGWASFTSGAVLTKSSGNGAWYLHIQAKDSVGNTVNTSSKAFQLDNTAPTVTKVQLQKPDGSTYTSGDWTNQKVTVSVYATDGESGVNMIQYSLDNGGTWRTYSTPLSFTSGTHSLQAKATDKAGNTSTVVSKTVNIDSTAPTVTNIQLQKPDGSTYTSGDWTSQNVTASVYATDGESGVNTIQYSLDNGGTWQTYSTPLSFTSGTHSLQVKATDKAGNTSTVVSKTVNIDSTVPTVTVSLKNQDGSTYTSGDWTHQTVTASVYATDTLSGLKSVQYSKDNGSWTTYSNPISFSNDGTYTLKIQATDQMGNTVTSATYAVNITTMGLEVDVPLKYTDGSPYTSGTWTNQSVTASVYANQTTAGVTITSKKYSVNGGSWQTYTSPVSFTNDGTYTIEGKATDSAGNSMTSAVYNINIDKTAPTVVFGTNGNSNAQANVSTTVTVSDLSGSGIDINSLQYAWTQNSTTPGGGTTWTSFTNGATLTKNGVNGVWYLHIQEQDNAGNVVTVNNVSNRFQLDASTAELSGLTLSEGTLSPSFASGMTDYTVKVGSHIISMTVTPVYISTTDHITVSVNGGPTQTVTSGTASGPLDLNKTVNTVTIEDTALNGAHHTYTITVNRVSVKHVTITKNNSGGVSVTVDPSFIKKITQSDGTVIEQVTLDTNTMDQVLTLLKSTEKPHITIDINDTERVVQVQLPASSMVEAAKSFQDVIIEVKLNGSSYQLAIQALDLEKMAKELGVDLKDLKLNVTLERVNQQTQNNIQQIATTNGLKLASSVIDFKVTVEANGQTKEITNFGGTYMARSIVPNANTTNKNLIGVLYDSMTKTFRFVPSESGTRSDGKQEMVMNVPHNSMYAVVSVQPKTFADLNGHWAKKDVELLASHLIIKGVTKDKFEPNANITRAQLTALLVRSLGISTVQNNPSTGFTDVASTAWYAPAITAAVKAGLIHGYKDGSFKPNQPINREELAVLIDQAIQFVQKTSDAGKVNEAKVLNPFTDQGEIAAWAKQEVANLVQAGLVHGRSATQFAPKAHTTRAEAAVLIERLLKQLHFIN